MRKSSTIVALFKRISIFFFMWLFLFHGIQAQQNNLSNERLKVWENMIHKNHVYVSAYVGHGSYSMYGMRRLQHDLVVQSGLQASANSDFPPFWLYGLSISQKYDASKFGFNVESMSTGARSSIADYSGQFISDFRCRGLKLGVFIEKDLSFKIKGNNGLSFGYRLEAGGLSSTVLQQTQITIIGLEEGAMTNTLKLISIAPFLEPAFFAKWQLDRKTMLQLSAGFMLDIPSDFRFDYYSSSPEYKIGWAGYRVKLGLVRQL